MSQAVPSVSGSPIKKELPERVGLIAGAGRLPIRIAEEAQKAGISVTCVGLPGMADPVLADICDNFHRMRRMALNTPSKVFRRYGVVNWTMAGKFHKHLLIKSGRWVQLLPDLRGLRFWYSRRRKNNSDDSLLLGLIEEYRKDGLECVSALEICPELLVKPGVLTRRGPTAAEQADIEFGWYLAKEMGRLDVGQSVMVRERAVLAVEAIEGTDLAIKRAGELARGAPFVVVKVAKPNQDMRFDVPTVGTQTLQNMADAGAKVLAIEAGMTIFLDEAETVALADKLGIAIVARTE